ncbi:hypothetical protein HBI59_014950, partial [Parastagonospora nodorum]
PGWTCDRLERVQQHLALYQEKINEVADVLDNYRINGVDAYDARRQEYHQTLHNHRRQVVHLKKQQGAISKEKESNAKRAKLAKDERDQRAVAEVERQGAIARHGTEASIKSAESRAYEYARTDARKGMYIPAAAFPSHLRAPVAPIDLMKHARSCLMTYEHARLASGR